MLDCIIAMNDLTQAELLRSQLEQGGFPVKIIGAITEWTGLKGIVTGFRVDVLFVSPFLKGMGNLHTLSTALASQPSCAVVIATKREEFSYELASEALEINAQGYILLPAEEKHLSRVMGSVIQWLYCHNTRATIPDPEEDAEKNESQNMADRIYNFISENHREAIGMTDIVEHFSISESYVNRLLMKYYNKTFKKILTGIRLTRARQLLREQPQLTVGDIARRVGYTDEYYFSKAYKMCMGVTPTNDRNEQEKSDTEKSDRR